MKLCKSSKIIDVGVEPKTFELKERIIFKFLFNNKINNLINFYLIKIGT